MTRNVGPAMDYVAVGDDVFPSAPAPAVPPLVEGDRVRYADWLSTDDPSFFCSAARGFVRSFSGVSRDWICVTWDNGACNFTVARGIVRATD
jgi:hypothetical protein